MYSFPGLASVLLEMHCYYFTESEEREILGCSEAPLGLAMFVTRSVLD